jgi:ABC-type spermidine/putrescine transport system permease subunit II
MIIGLMVLVVTGPLIPLLLWACAYRWDFPRLLPEWGLWGWSRAFSPKILEALKNSIIISVFVVALSCAFSFFAAKQLGTKKFWGRRAIEFLLLIPTFIPQISVVFGMQTVFRQIGLYSSFAGVVAAQLVFYVPYMTLLLSAVFQNYGTEFEAQAACLGVGKAKTLLHITLPSIRPGLIVTCVFSFIGSWSVYLLTALIGPPALTTLPVLLFPMMSSGNNSYPLIAAVTILYISPVLLLLLFVSTLLSGGRLDPGLGAPL